MSRNILFGFPARLLGFSQPPGRLPACPTEYAFRRGFALPAVDSSCTSAQKINPFTTLEEARTHFFAVCAAQLFKYRFHMQKLRFFYGLVSVGYLQAMYQQAVCIYYL